MRNVVDETPVVTGRGLVTGLGFGVEAHRAALAEGRSAIRGVEGGTPGTGLAAFVEEPYLRAEVPAHLEAQVKFLNGSGRLAVEAAIEACREAGWRADDAGPERRGLWLSQMDAWDWSCVDLRPGFVDATDGFTRPLESEALNASSARRVKPFFLLESLKNNAFSFLANLFELQGANTGTAGFDTATMGLLDLAVRALRRGDLDRALVVAAGRVAAEVARLDLVIHGLARPSDDAAYRPLDAGGVGVVPGEGAAAITLEARGRSPSVAAAALLGFGAATGEPLDGVRAPRASTVEAAIQAALAEAEVATGDVAAVVLPAFGLPEADTALLRALDACSGLEGVPAVSWRGAVGHTALASDLVDLVVAADGLRQGRLPGTVGVRDPLDVGGREIATGPVATGDRGVLLVSAGLCGQAAALVLGSVG